MEVNFDKEMDALLRQTARQEKPAPVAEAHLDADELSAFSANALPVNARARAMEHLVDCGNCRTILSNLVFFEDQDEEKPAMAAIAASSAVKQASLAERIIGFFKFPALAYGMAGLVLVFTAGIALMMFRGSSGDAEVAQLSKKDMPAAAKAVPEQYSEPLNEAASSANSNMAAANSTGSPSIANRGSWGGEYTPPLSEAPSGAANSSSNMTLGVPVTEEDRIRVDTTKNSSGSVGGSIKADDEPKAGAAPPPAPVVTTKQLQELAKPQNNTDQMKGQDNYRLNNTILTPDGVDKDRNRTVQRAVQAEAGANAPRDSAIRDEKEKSADASVDVTTTAPVKTESKKVAGKKPKKKTNAAATESDTKPEAKPTPSPAKKKPDEEDPRR